MKKPEPKEYPFNQQTRKKKYKCKKGKGDHKFVVTWAHESRSCEHALFVHYQCSVCGKNRLDFEKV